jgi:hypothetical protein
MSRIQYLSAFSLALNEKNIERASDLLDQFFEAFIQVDKKILGRNIDPTTELTLMHQLYQLTQDLLMYIKCDFELRSPRNCQLLNTVSQTLLHVVCHPESP